MRQMYRQEAFVVDLRHKNKLVIGVLSLAELGEICGVSHGPGTTEGSSHWEKAQRKGSQAMKKHIVETQKTSLSLSF